jgi:polysaccharide biosynthesis/export protein
MGQVIPSSSEAAAALNREMEGRFVDAVSPSMRAVEIVIRELAQSDVPVLVLAEAGAGKHSTAQRIHQLSRRSQEQFQLVECSGLSAENFQTTCAAILGNGTIHLDEIGDLDAECQLKLLEILPRVEGDGIRPAAARLICSSARDLEAEIRAGRFREDLYYRVSGVCLRLPPLRQRKEDIPFLVSFFLARYADEFERPVPALSAETERLFQEYTWPGNIRELEDAAKAIVALGNESLAMGGLRALLRKSSPAQSERMSLKQAARAASREAEKELILNTLTRTRWNRRRAAQELQISYKALLYKLKQIGFGSNQLGLGILCVALAVASAQDHALPADTRTAGGMAAPASVAAPDYIIGAEDMLQVSVWKEPDLTNTLPVRPDGKISLPLLNDVQAAGLTPMQLGSSITEKLKKFMADPRVTVVVTQINSQRVYVLGEVLHTGSINLLPNMTVLQALATAGFTQFANTGGIYVLRAENGKQQKIPIRYKKLVKGEGIDQNLVLKPGDTIVVP